MSLNKTYIVRRMERYHRVQEPIENIAWLDVKVRSQKVDVSVNVERLLCLLFACREHLYTHEHRHHHQQQRQQIRNGDTWV